MANHSDLEKIQRLLQASDNIVIGTSFCYSSNLWGKYEHLENYYLLILRLSTGPKNLSCDELSQKIKPIVLNTAKLSAEKARDQICSKMRSFYPENYSIVLLWNAGQIVHTTFSNHYAWSRFQTSDNKDYGHDVLVIIH